MWASGPRQALPPLVQSDERLLFRWRARLCLGTHGKRGRKRAQQEEREVFRVFALSGWRWPSRLCSSRLAQASGPWPYPSRHGDNVLLCNSLARGGDPLVFKETFTAFWCCKRVGP